MVPFRWLLGSLNTLVSVIDLHSIYYQNSRHDDCSWSGLGTEWTLLIDHRVFIPPRVEPSVVVVVGPLLRSRSSPYSSLPACCLLGWMSWLAGGPFPSSLSALTPGQPEDGERRNVDGSFMIIIIFIFLPSKVSWILPVHRHRWRPLPYKNCCMKSQEQMLLLCWSLLLRISLLGTYLVIALRLLLGFVRLTSAKSTHLFFQGTHIIAKRSQWSSADEDSPV